MTEANKKLSHLAIEALDRATVTANAITLARYYAKQAVKEQWRAQGLKLHCIEASELSRAAEAYLSQHRDELITFATERYRNFVESGRVQRQRNQRNPSQ